MHSKRHREPWSTLATTFLSVTAPWNFGAISLQQELAQNRFFRETLYWT